MNEQRIIIADLPATKALANDLAMAANKGDVFCLTGDLGAGKTEFARAFIQSYLGEDVTVTSPTFNILQIYEPPTTNHQPSTIYHFDLYRLKDASELQEIGLEDALQFGVSLIEWPQIAEADLPKDRKQIHIEFLSEDTRKITIR